MSEPIDRFRAKYERTPTMLGLGTEVHFTGDFLVIRQTPTIGNPGAAILELRLDGRSMANLLVYMIHLRDDMEEMIKGADLS